MTATMVYDIETVPDIEFGRRLLNCPDANSREIADALAKRRLEQTNGATSFLPHYLQKIVAISVVVRTDVWVKVWSLGEPESNEHLLISRFFQGIERYTPNLVSWNGNGFDLPVLHYRSLLHGVVSPQYWETGERDPNFKWNNYLNRYHQKHLDLMDVLSGYQSRAYASLDEISKLLKLPGKIGIKGEDVFEKFMASEIQDIRHYCETDVLNTYLIFLKFQLIRGHLTEAARSVEEKQLKAHLLSSQKPHLLEFLEAWELNEK